MTVVPAIETREISKRFGAVQANDRISLTIAQGAVHGIVGENGAGKSTLLKMLFGFYTPNSGDILVNGIHCRFASATDAMAAGIAMVHQHFMLIEPFTVLENIILGAEGSSLLGKARSAARQMLKALEEQFGFDIPLNTPVSHLSVGQRQRVEILKALYRGAEILILDEPTAVLTPQECDQLFTLIDLLKNQGKTILFVTHKLHEIMAVTDTVTVIRAGRVITQIHTSDTTTDALAEAMVGARISRAVQASARDISQQPRLMVRSVCAHADLGHMALDHVSFELFDGEVLGIAGVAGNGQTELLEVIAGMRPVADGDVTLAGICINAEGHMTNPIALRNMGLAHVAEDRLKTGVISSMSGRENAMLGYQCSDKFSQYGLVNQAAVAAAAMQYFDDQDVRPRNPDLPISALSGGNQQKLVIARELAHDPQTMIIGQPTRGVDIGAVTKIHDQIISMRNQGKAVLVVSADLDELLAISDRIAVMCDGKLVGIVPVDAADERTLGLMMAGGTAGVAGHSA